MTTQVQTAKCKQCFEPIELFMGRWLHHRSPGVKTTRCDNRNTVAAPHQISKEHLDGFRVAVPEVAPYPAPVAARRSPNVSRIVVRTVRVGMIDRLRMAMRSFAEGGSW